MSIDIYMIANGRLLTPDGISDVQSIVVSGGTIAAVGEAVRQGGLIDAEGLLIAPGLVDLHGDAFERQIMPRPKARFSIPLALTETDRQLVANGITTAFHAVTWSWEPGLRSRASIVALAEAIEALRPRLSCDTRLHVRFEIDNLDAIQEACEWLASGRIDLLAFNDHTEDMRLKAERDPNELITYAQRTGLPLSDFRELVDKVGSRRNEVEGAVTLLSAAAAAAGVPMLSHDDDSPEIRQRYFALGAGISEFPKTLETAQQARQLGNHVVMGAPNVVRGGSHQNAVSAVSLVASRLCDILASDYYYPALLAAPFQLAEAGLLKLHEGWQLVSNNPARAAGLHDRGVIGVGRRADLIAMDVSDPALPNVVLTMAQGRVVYATAGAADRMASVRTGGAIRSPSRSSAASG
jgi:alpha-D-ribose 1-methylphosphonate 5-triphosphate diphosphatase